MSGSGSSAGSWKVEFGVYLPDSSAAAGGDDLERRARGIAARGRLANQRAVGDCWDEGSAVLPRRRVSNDASGLGS